MELQVGSITRCAGMLEDGQNTCLLTYGKRYYENEIQTHQMVVGLSLENGEELFTRKIPARSHDQVILVPGTTLALCCRNDLPQDDMVMYHWKKERKCIILKLHNPLGFRHLLRLNNGVLTVLAINVPHGYRLLLVSLGADAVTEAKNGDNLYGFGKSYGVKLHRGVGERLLRQPCSIRSSSRQRGKCARRCSIQSMAGKDKHYHVRSGISTGIRLKNPSGLALCCKRDNAALAKICSGE